jgi:hypothetical protein
MSPLGVLTLAAACAAPPPPVDPNTYLRHLVGRQRQQEEALSRYTYDVTEAREELDGQGRVVRRRERSYEVFHVKGRPVRRLVARDGQPLPPEERAARDRKAREMAQAIREGRVAAEQPGVRISRILERYDFRAGGSEEIDGRCARVFDFAARPGDSALERDFLLKKLAGRIWVDAGEDAVVRLDVRNTSGVRLALGLAASVSTASFQGEFQRLEAGVWLPKQLQGSARGKKLVVFSFHLRERLSFSNYRRFDVSIEEKPRPEWP